jgi:site-specific DNA-cytosine methylase
VVNVDVTKLDKIDLLLGGSPCQSFSFAGKRKGMSTKCETEILTLEHYLELKEQGFEFEGQSYLFWEYMRILTDIRKINPNAKFLLENVEMGEKWEKVLSKAIGVNGIHINSALVSAQNRKRIYWTNIGMQPGGLFGDMVSTIQQPKDKGILLKDILESEVDKKYYLSDNMLKKMQIWDDTGNGIIGYSGSGGQKGSIFNNTNKVGSLCATDYKQPKQICVASRGRNPENPKSREAGLNTEQQLEPRFDGKTNCLTSVQKDNLLMTRELIIHNIPEIVNVRKYEVDILSLQKTLKEHKNITNQQIADALNVPKTMVEHWFRTDNYFSIPDKDVWLRLKELLGIVTKKFDESIMVFEQREGVFDKSNRVYDEEGIAPTLTCTSADERILVREVKQLNPSKESGGKQPFQQKRVYDENGISPALCANKSDLLINTSRIRRLTPTECERLQTVKDGYTSMVSDSQRYRMLGNGWTIDVICHILSYLKD